MWFKKPASFPNAKNFSNHDTATAGTVPVTAGPSELWMSRDICWVLGGFCQDSKARNLISQNCWNFFPAVFESFFFARKQTSELCLAFSTSNYDSREMSTFGVDSFPVQGDQNHVPCQISTSNVELLGINQSPKEYLKSQFLSIPTMPWLETRHLGSCEVCMFWS